MADSNGAVMTNIWNTEFTNYVNYLKNEGMGSLYNKAFNHTTISVNLEGLRDNLAQFNAAKNALGLLSKFTGLSFTLTTSTSADIVTDNNDPSGAYATSTYSGSTILHSTVNVARDWVSNWSIGQYGVQTFIHEFGHALGLNHGGPYNGNGDYATDAIFNIDTWQYSIMSYFTQDNYDSASYLYLIGPMIGDIKALNDLYGRLSANAGNTLYGRGETAISGWTDFGRYSQATYCINDTSGIDTMDYSNTATANTIDLRAGFFSDINGYRGNVSIAIGTVIENASGGSGADTIFGNAVSNTLRGNGGNDRLWGGSGSDLLDGGTGVDAAYYSDSTVGLRASLLNPSLNTGIALGDRYLSIENLYGSNFNDALYGDNLANTIWGANGSDSLYGNGGNDYLRGGAGNDALIGGAGADILDGGDGTDTAYYTDSTVGLQINLLTRSLNTGIAAGDVYVSIENIFGSNYNDRIVGDNFNNSLWGAAGNDVLIGNGGSDSLIGGGGADTLNGGDGTDTAYYNDSAIGVTVSLLNPSSNTGIAAGDTYISIESLYGSAYNDTLIGDNLANTLGGGAGNDNLYGNGGNDAINGGAGNDYIVGGAGNDAIFGGSGLDRLFGGTGADRFVFTSLSDSTVATAGRDIIYDFSYASGDRIDLSLIDANSLVGGNQAFTFIGTAAFTGVAGQLHVEMSGSNTIVMADVNGDRIADFALTVANVNALSSLNYTL